MSNSKDIHSAKIAVVGSGLAGIAAVAALAESGCKDITVFDERTDPTVFETNRAYSQVLYQTGQRLLRKFPGLDHAFKKEAYCQHVRVVNNISADGKQQVTSTSPPAGPVYWMLKSHLLKLFHNYVKQSYPQVKVCYGTTVQGIVIEKQTSLLVKDQDGKEETFEFDVLFACDGSESKIREMMEERDNQIDSSFGMHIYSKNIPSTGMRHKGIVLDEAPIISREGEPMMVASPSVIYNIYGKRKNRPKTSVFDIVLLPVCAGKNVKRRAALLVKEGHKILSIKSVDEMYTLFKENFPQLQVERMFSREEMKVFTESSASTFPSLKRPMSLVGHFRNSGESKQSSIVFIGDSAHSFPPDTAQGVNSAFQDLEALMDILHKANKNTSWKDVLGMYETARDEETWALMQMMAIAAPYQYKQNTIGYIGYMMNKNIRKNLSNVLPGVIYEDVDTLVRQGMSYKKVRFLNNISKCGLALLTASLVALPIAILNSKSDKAV